MKRQAARRSTLFSLTALTLVVAAGCGSNPADSSASTGDNKGMVKESKDSMSKTYQQVQQRKLGGSQRTAP